MKYVIKDENGNTVSREHTDVSKLNEQLTSQNGHEKGWFISVIHEQADTTNDTSLLPRQFLTD